MQPITIPFQPSRLPRETIHDLRNLFSVVASAKHLLDVGSARDQQLHLLEAIEDAATRGAALTTTLLDTAEHPALERSFDMGERVAGMEPMIRALAGSRIDVLIDIEKQPLPVRLDPTAFDATFLELFTNACTASAAHGYIIVRARRTGCRAWLTIADSGRGMDATLLAFARAGEDRLGAHGAGLARVRRFLRTAHGRFHVRSRPGRGTIVSLNLPTVLKLAPAGLRHHAEVPSLPLAAAIKPIRRRAATG